MPDPKQIESFFEMLSRVLLRCWIFGFVLLFVWFGIILFTSDVIHRQLGGMFGLSSNELQLIHYCAMALTKIQVLLFFFFPWLAIKHVLRDRQA